MLNVLPFEERPEPPRRVPYDRVQAAPLAIAAHNERRMVIWQRKSRRVVRVYGDVLTVTESGVKCVKTGAAWDDWYDWTYYAPQTGDVFGWEYVNRSQGRFEVIGVCS